MSRGRQDFTKTQLRNFVDVGQEKGVSRAEAIKRPNGDIAYCYYLKDTDGETKLAHTEGIGDKKPLVF